MEGVKRSNLLPLQPPTTIAFVGFLNPLLHVLLQASSRSKCLAQSASSQEKKVEQQPRFNCGRNRKLYSVVPWIEPGGT